MKRIKAKGVEMIFYEPALKKSEFYRSKVVNDLVEFKQLAGIIVATRWLESLSDVECKVYTPDLFGNR